MGLRRRGWALPLWAALACGCETPRDEPVQPPEASSATATVVAAASVSATASTKAPEAPPGPIRVAFAGDVCLSLHVGIHMDAREAGKPVPEGVDEHYPFSHVRDRLRAADLLIGNLECVASDKGTLATDHNPFRCAKSSPKALLDAGFDAMSVANNHAKDFGPRGLEGTIENLEAAKLPPIGRETFTYEPQNPFVHTVRGTKIGVLAYYYPPKNMGDVIRAVPFVDALIVFMHWGTEDRTEPMEMQKRLARELIDAGADIVVGTHAHVLQPVDWYEGHFIAYGLGNFVFTGMNDTEKHRVGALLELDLWPPEGEGQLRVEPRLIQTRLDELGAPRFVVPPDEVETIAPPAREGDGPIDDP